MRSFWRKKRLVEEEKDRLYKMIVKPTKEVQEMLTKVKGSPLKDAVRAYDLLKRPEVKYEHLESVIESNESLPQVVKEQVEIQIKYEGYIKKTYEQVGRMQKNGRKTNPRKH